MRSANSRGIPFCQVGAMVKHCAPYSFVKAISAALAVAWRHLRLLRTW